MKSMKVLIAAVVCICVCGCGCAGASGLPGMDSAADPAADPEWLATLAACRPVIAANIAGLGQLYQIGKGEPHTALWSPDGETIALSTGTGVHLFDGHTLEPLGILRSGYTTHIAWSQDSALLALCAAGDAGDEVQVWDVSLMEKKFAIKQKRSISDLYVDQKNNSVLALGLQQSGANQYGVPAYKAYLDTYSLKTGKKKGDSVSFAAADKNLMEMNLSYGGTVVFGAGTSECYLWSAKGKLLYNAALSYPMYARSVSGPDVSAILDLMRLNTLQIIDRSTKQKTANAPLPKRISKLEWIESAQELILYTSKGYMLYDLEAQEVMETVTFQHNYGGSVWISGDRSRLFQLNNGALKLADIASGDVLGEQSGYDDRAWQVAVSGDRLAASKGSVWTGDTRLMLWNLDTLAESARIGSPEFSASISDMQFLPDETELLIFASGEDSLKIWNAATGTNSREMIASGKMYGAALSVDGATLVVGYGGSVGVMPWANTAAEQKFYMSSFVGSVSLNAAGNRAAACDGEMVIVWDLDSQSELFYIGDGTAAACFLNAAGDRIAVLYYKDEAFTVRMMDVETGDRIWTYKLADNYQRMCFTPGGDMLAISAYKDGLIFLNAETGKEIFTLDYNVSDFSFSRDGRLLATASSDGTVRLWGVTLE